MTLQEVDYTHAERAVFPPATARISAMRTVSERNAQLSRGLARSPVFGVLSDETRARLAASGTIVNLSNGGRLCSTGDLADAAYFVIMGELDVVLSRPDGVEVWLARVTAGDVVGDMALLDGGARSADVTATRNCRLLRLGRETVLEALATEPAAALELLAHFARLLRDTNGRVEEAATLDLGARLARILLSAPNGLIARSQSDLARLVGAARESVNRKLSQWRAAGIVAIRPSGIRVLNAERLRALALPEG